MCGRWTTMAALAIGALLAGTATAGDTKRLVDRPTDRSDTRTLELKPTDRDATDTELTHWGRGWGGWGGWGRGWGWGGGWGGWGWGRGWGVGLSFASGYRPWGGWGWGGLGWGGYPSWGVGYYGWPSYYSGSFGWPSYSLYSPAYYTAPLYSYYAVPAVSYYAMPLYYASPVIASDCCASGTIIPERVETQRPSNGGTYRHEGDPAKQIPPARPADSIPAPMDLEVPKAPKIGPSPTERPISLPAVQKRFEYPAYGEGPDARPVRRPARELLVSK